MHICLYCGSSCKITLAVSSEGCTNSRCRAYEDPAPVAENANENGDCFKPINWPTFAKELRSVLDADGNALKAGDDVVAATGPADPLWIDHVWVTESGEGRVRAVGWPECGYGAGETASHKVRLTPATITCTKPSWSVGYLTPGSSGVEPINVRATQTGRFSCREPNYSNPPRYDRSPKNDKAQAKGIPLGEVGSIYGFSSDPLTDHMLLLNHIMTSQGDLSPKKMTYYFGRYAQKEDGSWGFVWEPVKEP